MASVLAGREGREFGAASKFKKHKVSCASAGGMSALLAACLLAACLPSDVLAQLLLCCRVVAPRDMPM